MSFIYDMADTWNAIGTTFNAIKMNISNGAGGAPVGAAASRAFLLQANGTKIFDVDISGNITASNASFSSGIITTSQPFSITQTWNAGAVNFVGLGLTITNTASGGSALIAQFKVGSTSLFDMDVAGNTNLNSTPGTWFAARFANSTQKGQVDVTGVKISSDATLSFASTASSNGTADTILARDAANTLAQRNGTVGQTFRMYETFTDSLNYSRISLAYLGGTYFLNTEVAGSGTDRTITMRASALFFGPNAIGNTWTIPASGHWLVATDNSYDIGGVATRPRFIYPGSAVKYASITLASLSASVIGAVSAGAGAEAYISDGNVPLIFTTVAGSGTTPCPVYSDGTQWRAG